MLWIQKASFLSYLLTLYFLGFTGCTPSGFSPTPEPASDRNRTNFGSIFGERIQIHGKRSSQKKQIIQDIPVNKFLWEASIQLFSFMPILTANPQRGRILTDWYSDPNYPFVRTRLLIIVTGKELRSDAIQVFIERQKRTSKKIWKNWPMHKEGPHQIECMILKKARVLRHKLFQDSEQKKRQKKNILTFEQKQCKN